MTRDLCEALTASSRGWTGDSPTGAMLTSTRAFLTGAAENPDLLGEVAASLNEIEPGAAAWIAVTCGTAVERGAPAELSGPAVFALLRSWLPKFPVVSEDAGSPPEVTMEQTALLPPFQYLCQATVTHLARLPAQRESMGQDMRLLERLAEIPAHGAVWVREALLKSSGTLVFLHPSSRAGLRLRYTNVSNCFHLFSLLQTAIGTGIPGGCAPDATIARVARGKSTEEVNDEAWWHYGTAASNQASIAASIWGEGLVREIPLVEGERVILAWPPLLQSRSWDAGFLGPHLEAMPADAVIESPLTAAESAAWVKRLDLAPRKKWWRFGSQH
jgi:hypothetical protein